MIVRKATPTDIRHVLSNLTPLGHSECLARTANDDLAHVIERMIFASRVAVSHLAFAQSELHQPSLILGVWEESPGVALLHGAVTTEVKPIGRAWGLYWVRHFVPEVMVNYRVATMSVDAGHLAWISMLARLGFGLHGRPLPYGRQGELFQDLVWLNRNYGARTVDRPLPAIRSAPPPKPMEPADVQSS